MEVKSITEGFFTFVLDADKFYGRGTKKQEQKNSSEEVHTNFLNNKIFLTFTHIKV